MLNIATCRKCPEAELAPVSPTYSRVCILCVKGNYIEIILIGNLVHLVIGISVSFSEDIECGGLHLRF